MHSVTKSLFTLKLHFYFGRCQYAVDFNNKYRTFIPTNIVCTLLRNFYGKGTCLLQTRRRPEWLVGECDTVQGLKCSREETLFLRLSSTSAQFGPQPAAASATEKEMGGN